ncbi:hypothetical protein GA0115252_10033 [Streptomyces sp. DfronAA-171]|nr:hypothetical protein GA0115252_10033 [Streptomyces sp. DfronAA-171]
MSWTISSGASKPKSAGFPVLSRSTLWPASSSAFACSITGPRIS